MAIHMLIHYTQHITAVCMFKWFVSVFSNICDMYIVSVTTLGSPRAVARPLAKVALAEERITPWDDLASTTHSPKKQHVGVQRWLS